MFGIRASKGDADLLVRNADLGARKGVHSRELTLARQDLTAPQLAQAGDSDLTRLQ